jgi:hypothetical protein
MLAFCTCEFLKVEAFHLGSFVQIVWCAACRRAVCFSLMPDTESPATLFELLYCFFPQDKKLRISYDNGCQFLSYALNRAPRWAGQVRVMIDELHHHGHKACATSFSTGMSLSSMVVLFSTAYGSVQQTTVCVTKFGRAHNLQYTCMITASYWDALRDIGLEMQEHTIRTRTAWTP